MTRLLDDAEELLVGAGFVTRQWTLTLGTDPHLPAPHMLWAEHRDFLAAVTTLDVWKRLEGLEEDLVAAVASRAEALDPSPRIWDLTVVVLVASRLAASERQTAVPWATETRYARRVLAVSVSKENLRRALAPVLPLNVSPAEELLEEPADALLRRLAASVGTDIADSALRSFRATGSIQL